jgi:hypothetical protein
MSPASSRKSLDAERNAVVRTYVKRVVEEDFEGNVSAAAVAFGVTQPTLSDFLNENRGAGIALLDGVARHRNVSIDVVMGRVALDDPYPNRAAVMATPEFKAASPAVREAFATLRGATGGADRSVFAWAQVLADLMKADALGLLESGGGRLLTPPTKTPRK